MDTAGSTITRIDLDGSEQLDVAAGYYRSTDGGGAYEMLRGDSAGWTWQGKARAWTATVSTSATMGAAAS